ncbi:MAG TPA: zinc-binding dehydrogenase, partial [Candidatus Marinimicrobia bacterium]|nr:zinc-binding dehydrogenase [Candidatus Neomarinimicrobiota bacterium]
MTECQSIFVTKHGVPDVLKLKSDSLKEPIIGEVCVKIKYSGINFADIMGRMGLYPTAPKPPYVPGFEIAGIIEKTGDDKTKNLVGRAVVGLSRFHGYSTHTNVPVNQLFFINEKWLDVAAAIPVNYLTAYFMMIHQAAIRENEWFLIHGIGGGVGIAALQIAQHLGVKIIGTCSGWKHDQIREMGVEHLIDYRSENFKDRVLEITDGNGADVIIDSLGGKALKDSFGCLAEFGRLISYGFSKAAPGTKKNILKILPEYLGMPKFNPMHLMSKNKGVFGFHLGLIKKRQDLVKKYGSLLLKWLDDGIISPKVDAVFPLE